jgi:hypothetical protein
MSKMKLRAAATGDKKVPVADRVYFVAAFPRERPLDPRPVFLSRRWTVGRAIDHLATVARAVNENNRVGGRARLDIYVGDATTALPVNTELQLLLGAEFAEGDTIRLEREDAINHHQESAGE